MNRKERDNLYKKEKMKQFNVRIRNEEFNKIENIRNKHKLKRIDIIREGVKKYENKPDIIQ